jgi:hypothetical protein
VEAGYVQILAQFLGHLFKSVKWGPEAKSGMSRTKHLWNWISEVVPHADLVTGDDLKGGCSDMSACTDSANPLLAKYFMSKVHEHFRRNPNYPSGLSMLVVNLMTAPWPILIDRRLIMDDVETLLAEHPIVGPILDSLGKVLVLKWVSLAMGHGFTKFLLTGELALIASNIRKERKFI